MSWGILFGILLQGKLKQCTQKIMGKIKENRQRYSELVKVLLSRGQVEVKNKTKWKKKTSSEIAWKRETYWEMGHY